YPEAGLKDEAARTYLGQFGISGLLALEPLYILSGGQKSRVAIALMAFNNPHILILDEPTNHLDLDAVQALIAALNNFKGGVLLVSHDSHLLSCVVEEIFYMDEQAHKLQKYHGDFLKYRKELLKRAKTAAAAQANH
ncbi:ATP-binding cassette sub-family F member 1, partial [Toxoplasma gondii RUB]